MALDNTGNNDFLIESLVELAAELEKHRIPCIVGGGLAQYIRAAYFAAKTSPRYKYRIIQRTTKDIDFFLTSDIIVNASKVEIIKSILKKLNFEVGTPYFQFYKKISSDDEQLDVRIDILTEPPKSEDLDKVTMKKPPRIKPIGIDKFHAFEHKEARGLDKYLIKVEDFVGENDLIKFKNIYLPSAIHFIIMKLFAFRDRLDDRDKEFGRHHAFDIFSTITLMSEFDWRDKQEKIKIYDPEIVAEARKIISEYFQNINQFGSIKIQENKVFQRNPELYREYLGKFIEDITDLFDINK